MSEYIEFGYASSSNITFRGTLGSRITREEWDEWPREEQNDYLAEELFNLVDIWVVD